MKPTDEQIILAAQTHNSMSAACAALGIHFNTFKKKALELGVYNTNQSGKGVSKATELNSGIPLREILAGHHPQYQTYKLKHRLFKEGIKKNQCEICQVSEWLGNPIACELDHIDGDSKNHRLENLGILCPNCHSQTDTFRSRNIARVVERYTHLT